MIVRPIAPPRAPGGPATRPRAVLVVAALFVAHACAPGDADAEPERDGPSVADSTGPTSTPPRDDVPALLDTTGVAPELVAAVEAAVARVRAAPEDRDAWLELASIYDANQIWSLARPAYEAVLALGTDGPTHYHLGRMRAWLGDATGAIESFGASLEERPNYPGTWWRRGDVHLELGRLDEARRDYERAVELAPGASPARLGLARIALLEERPEAVLEHLEPLVEANPTEHLANGLLARAYHRLGRTPQAQRAERREARSVPSAVSDPWVAAVQRHALGVFVDVERAGMALRSGDTEQALALLEGSDDDLSALNLRVRAHLKAGRPAEALREAERARELHGPHYRVELALGRALAELGRLGEARVTLERSLSQNPRYAESLAALGEVQLRLGELDAAAASFQAALDEGSDSLRHWSLLARARILLGEHEAALAVLERALEDFPSSPLLWGQRADALARSGRLAEAERALERVEARDPGNEILPKVRARIAAAREGR